MIWLCIAFIALAIWMIKSIGDSFGAGSRADYDHYIAYYRRKERFLRQHKKHG